MASRGWNYRTAFFKDFDGKYYKITISTAQSADGKMIYNIGQMQERSIPQIDGSSAANSGALRGDASVDSLSRGVQNVKLKFSMETPVEETDKLIAVHNKDESSIMSALKLGGLPMPSIAVVKASEGHSKYGPISLVFNKATIDPQADSRNKVYGGDAWDADFSTPGIRCEQRRGETTAEQILRAGETRRLRQCPAPSTIMPTSWRTH